MTTATVCAYCLGGLTITLCITNAMAATVALEMMHRLRALRNGESLPVLEDD